MPRRPAGRLAAPPAVGPPRRPPGRTAPHPAAPRRSRAEATDRAPRLILRSGEVEVDEPEVDEPEQVLEPVKGRVVGDEMGD